MRRKFMAIALISFVGLIDSAYLTFSHFLNFAVPCSVTHGCETVLHSAYSSIGPIPLALLGVLYYLAIGFLALFVATSSTISKRLTHALFIGTTLGIIMSITFELIQVFIIHAICQYCALSALCTLLMWGMSVLTVKHFRRVL